MDNYLELYEKVRNVPREAQKTIGGGRLKGMTDINPMWRIKTLTEQFGPCGFGWYYDIVEKWIETSMAKDEVTANVMINLYVKQGEEWSKPIVGVGGSMLVANEKNGLYVDDECYKKALTDAISVACKALGMGADIYWANDRTKYSNVQSETRSSNTNSPAPEPQTNREKVIALARKLGIPFDELMKDYGITKQTTEERFGEILKDMEG